MSFKYKYPVGKRFIGISFIILGIIMLLMFLCFAIIGKIFFFHFIIIAIIFIGIGVYQKESDTKNYVEISDSEVRIRSNHYFFSNIKINKISEVNLLDDSLKLIHDKGSSYIIYKHLDIKDKDIMIKHLVLLIQNKK